MPPEMSNAPSGPVTLLFSDIESSTSLWDDHPDAMREAHTRHNEILSSAFDAHGGRVLKDKGDGFIVVFSNPVQALEAAAAAQRHLTDGSWPDPIGSLRVRMGINTGIVEPRDGDYYGPQVNRTARLEDLAHGGQVLVSDATRALVSGELGDGLELRDLGLHSLRGFSEPERVFQLMGAGLQDEFPPLRGPKRGSGLPAFENAFVGRDSQVKEIADLIQGGARLVTLLGPGGIGKTRLAVEAARELEHVMSGGAHFADLAPLPSPERVGVTVAESVGVHAEGNADVLSLVADTVTDPTLVVVDNFEHVIEASAAIGTLLSNTPGLSVIATSRQPLTLRQEQVYRLNPLDVVSNGQPSPAVELFYDRAAAQGVHLSEADRQTVESICAKLDGLPLAIELVAPRARLISVDELEKMLSKSLDALGSGAAYLPERHRTIRHAIDWSLEGLTDDQRTLFKRISCLPAGGTLAMIDEVCGEGLEGPVFDHLATLVDNSLVNSVTGAAGGTRFKQLALLREYGLELVKEAGEHGQLMDRLIDYYVDRSEATRVRLQTDSVADSEIVADHANLLAAMDWSLESGDESRMGKVLMDMWIYWFRGDRVADALEWVEKASALTRDPHVAWLSGFFAFQTGDFEQMGKKLAIALEGFREMGEDHGRALALTFQTTGEQDPEKAYEMVDEALDLFDDSEPAGRFVAIVFKSVVDFMVGDMEASLRRREEAMRLSLRLDMPELVAWMHWNLAFSYYGTAEYDEAAKHFKESFDYMAAENYQEGVASSAVGAGLCDLQAGRYERGLRLFGAADTTLERIGTVIWPEAAVHLEAASERVRQEAGESFFDDHYSAGRELSFVETVDLTAEALSDLTSM